MTDLSRNALCRCGSGAKYKKCCLPKDDAQRKPQTGEDGLVVCIPTRGAVSHETLVSLEHNMDGIKHATIRVARKPVDEARNILAKTALECIASNPFPFVPREAFVLWIDDDAWLPPGLVLNMMRCMRDPAFTQLDALFAWFCTRAPYSPPVAYRRFDDDSSTPKIGIDCRDGDVVPIEAGGFHCVLMRPRLLERIGPDPFTPLPEHAEGEDWVFCRRAKAIGAKFAVGTCLPAAHVDPRDGMAYMVGSPPFIVDRNELRMPSLTHQSADGTAKAGERRTYGLENEITHLRSDAARLEDLIRDLEQRRTAAEGAA